MRITPAIVEAVYEMLRATPPFHRWKLPESDDVEFHVTTLKDRFSDFSHFYERGKPRGKWKIRVDSRISHTMTLVQAMAHECIHLREALIGHRLDTEHGAMFKRLAAQVCRAHGFDPATF